MIMLHFSSFKLINSSFLLSLLISLPALAQVAPDTTLPNNSSVTTNSNTSTITGGTQAGGNLFHSFDQFSIPTGSTVYFNNTTDVQNIISRVTGKSVSSIDGLVRANGTANLFLLNPNGIIFGANAALNIGGSFLATTASSLNFADGNQFSATSPQTQPLLTISVPTGLQIGTNSGEIRVQGKGHNLTLSNPLSNAIFSPFTRSSRVNGLQVLPGKTLALIGGGLALEGGELTARSGRIELGSANEGAVSFVPSTTGWNFDYESVSSFKNISLSQKALVDTSGIGSGSIQVKGQKVSLNDGSVVLNQNLGGVVPGGGISINAFDSLSLDGTSPDGRIPSSLINESISSGAGGNIEVSTRNLAIRKGAIIATRTYGTARGGDVFLTASDSFQVTEYSSLNPELISLIVTGTAGSGNAGDVTLTTNQLSLINGGNIGTITLGTGKAGNISLSTTDIDLTGLSSNAIPSTLFAVTASAGNAGEFKINTERLRIKEGAAITSATLASGNAGSITIDATDSIEVSGLPPIQTGPIIYHSSINSAASIQPFSLQRFLQLPPIPSGESGSLNINTPDLKILDGAIVGINNFGSGIEGKIQLNVGTLLLDTGGEVSSITNSGTGGNTFIEAKILQLRHNSAINAAAIGSTGNGGNIDIVTDLLIALENSDIVANALQGNGGNINIVTRGIFGTQPRTQRTLLSDITASSESGVNGTIEINNLLQNRNYTILELPENFVDASQLVAQGCSANVRANASSFVVKGRGGLPEDPTKPINQHTYWTDLSLISLEEDQPTESITLDNSKPNNTVALVEASSWITNENGKVVLVASKPDISTEVPWLNSTACNAPQKNL